MIELINVTKVYKNYNNNFVTALKNINLKLHRTGLTFIAGESGSGKTTLLNILSGIDTPTEGEMTVAGVDLSAQSGGLDYYRNSYVGFVPQEYNLLDHLTLGQNIALAASIANIELDANAVSELFTKLGIGGFENRYPSQCSGGECQRAAIARVLIRKPKILFADEPTGSLDPHVRTEIYELLAKLSQEILVVTSSHNTELIERYADRLITLESGVIISDEIMGADKTSTEIFGGSAVFAVEAGSGLGLKDVEQLNAVLKASKKPVYLCLETSVDKVASNHPVEAKEITKALKIKREKKEKEKASKRAMLEDALFDVRSEPRKKSRLPLSSALNLCFVNLRSNKVRTIFTVILSIIAVTVFALTANLSSVTATKVNVNSFIASTDPYLILRNDTEMFNATEFDNWRTNNGEINTKSSLVFDFGASKFMSPNRFSSESLMYATSKLAILDATLATHKNVYGQELIAGNWPSESSPQKYIEIAISDFMASQLKTAYYIEHGTLLSFEELTGTVSNGVGGYLPANNLDIIEIEDEQGGALIRYRIRGVYRTDFTDYFCMNTSIGAGEFSGREVFSLKSYAKPFSALDLTLKPTLNKEQLSRALFYLENNYVTGYVAKSFIEGVTDGVLVQSAGNSIKIGGAMSITNNLGIGGAVNDATSSVLSADYFLTNHPLGNPTDLSGGPAFFENIDKYGIVIENSGVTGLLADPIKVSGAVYTDLLGGSLLSPGMAVSPLVFTSKIAKNIAGLTTYKDADSGEVKIARSAPTYSLLDNSLSFFTDAELLDTVTGEHEYVLRLNKTQYNQVVSALVAPTTSAILSRENSSAVIEKILANLPDSTEAIYSDSMSVDDYVERFIIIRDIFVVACVAFGLFAVLMLFNFVYQSMRTKRKNIAIIRTLGARLRDIALIFACEAIIVSLSIALGAFVLVSLAVIACNSLVRNRARYVLVVFESFSMRYLAMLACAVLIVLATYLIIACIFARENKSRGLVAELNLKTEN